MDIRKAFEPYYSERYRVAAEAHARAASEALRLKKMMERVHASLITHGEGSISSREYAAKCNIKYTEVEDAWIKADDAANLLRVAVDKIEIEFKEFQSVNANRRAEASIR